MNPASGTHDLIRIARRTMVERGMLPDFSPAALAETAVIKTAPTESSAAIQDLRGLLWSSIDNDESRDLDQIEVAQPLPDGSGAVKILIGVADVDAAVKKGTALDEHAQHNTTSVYTAVEIFPMLPPKLSTDLTSLGEGVDRMALIVEMVVAPDGAPISSNVYRAIVRNHAKLAYNNVAAWLKNEAALPASFSGVHGLDEQLRLQDRVAQTMKDLRHQHGALSLETIEAKAVFDDGTIKDLRPEEKNRAKELIEDFMIAANGATANYLKAKGFPTLRRVVRSPERWQRIVDLAAKLGETLPAMPDVKALEQFLTKRKAADPLRFPDLSLSVIKLLGPGEYVAEFPGESATGHFSLAVKDYSHSTAPNRRFPDLITQRLLKAALSGQSPPYSNDELKALAAHCTLKENDVNKVERQVRKSAAALLLQPRIGEKFDAIVTGASPKGTFVRIVQPPVEGKVMHGFEGLDVGDRVQVKLVGANVDRGLIDFDRI